MGQAAGSVSGLHGSFMAAAQMIAHSGEVVEMIMASVDQMNRETEEMARLGFEHRIKVVPTPESEVDEAPEPIT